MKVWGVFLIYVLGFLPFGAVWAQALKWQFTQDVGLNLPQCTSLAVKVDSTTSSSSTSKTTYFMIALAVNGTPTTSPIGSAGGNLQWTINQPVGSKLLLYVLDSNGQNAPTSPSLYTVSAGQSSDCISAAAATSFTVAGNATDAIQTCEPWSLSIRGGSPPYNVLLAALDSPSITNVSLPSGDNQYTYINRASPKSTLIAAISDSTGKWATGTPYVTTEGSSDTECQGKESTSNHVSLPDVSPTQVSSSSPPPTSSSNSGSVTSSNHTNKTPIIVGVVVGVVGLLLVIAAIFWLLRRRQARSSRPPASDVPHVVNPFTTSSEGSGMTALRTLDSSVPLSGSQYPSESFESSSARSPTTIIAPLRKPQATQNRSHTHLDASSGGDAASEMIVQHKDGRRINVQELPPAYGTQNE